MAFSTMPAGFPLAARLFRESAEEYGVLLEDPCVPLGSEAACRSVLNAAGFGDAETVSEPIEFSVRDLDRAWESNLRSLAHKPLRDLTAESLLALQQRYEAVLGAEMRADPTRLLKCPMLYAFARR